MPNKAAIRKRKKNKRKASIGEKTNRSIAAYNQLIDLAK